MTPTELVIDGEVDREDEDEMRRRKERSGEIVKELSDLVNYITPFHFKVRKPRSVRSPSAQPCASVSHWPFLCQGFEVARKNNCCYHMSSFAEKKAARYSSGFPEAGLGRGLGQE